MPFFVLLDFQEENVHTDSKQKINMLYDWKERQSLPVSLQRQVLYTELQGSSTSFLFAITNVYGV